MTIYFSSKDSSVHNINEISQHANRKAEAFRVVENIVKGKAPRYLIKTNNVLMELFLRAKHAICRGGQAHRQKLHDIIDSDIRTLNQATRTSYIDDIANTYTELFIASQKYNHILNMHLDPSLKSEVPLFDDLSLKRPIIPESCPQIAPIKIRIEQIAKSNLENIPKKQEPYIHQGSWWHRHKIYYYNEEDSKISHSQEAVRIFLSTQKERLISLIGRILEAITGQFKCKFFVFKDSHYFRKCEDKNGEIYAKDDPLSASENATSYWIGHATCFFNVPLKSERQKHININIITDPVEGDLNKILYPRMTRPARSIEACPAPHIYLLSHNHLDHYDKNTIKKLRKYQPIMLVPEGDAKKFRQMGFKNVYEHNWWQTTTIPIVQGDQKSEVKITAVPAHHWSGGLFEAHHSAFLGYIIHQEDGDIYFAGDTARLSDDHITTLRERFNIRSMFQPGGPDEVRKDMESTHQASVDGLWMHFNLMMRNLYHRGGYSAKSKAAFIEEAKKLRTFYMHTKTYKLGNLHFDDTDASVNRVKEALAFGKLPKETKVYEEQVYHELLAIGKALTFQANSQLEAVDILEILNAGVIIPKIGSRTDLAFN